MESTLDKQTGQTYLRAFFQAACLTLFTMICIHHSIREGLGLVGPIFTQGAMRLAQGLSPYLPPEFPADNWFRYPPFFAWLYYPFTLLSPVWHGFTWMTLNAFFFWWGLSRWQPISLSDKQNFKWILLFFALTAMELECAVRFRQNNAIMTGCILLGAFEYRQGKNWPSAAWLLLGVGIKVLPIIFAALFLFPVRRSFWIACIVTGILVILAPATTHGFHAIRMFPEWIMHMLSQVLPTYGQDDIASTLERLGVHHALAIFIRGVVFAITFIVVFSLRLFKREEFPWEMWISLVFMGIILCSPKTEVPSYVMYTPFCVFYGKYVLKSWRQGNRLPVFGYVIPIFLISGVHNDLFFIKFIWPQFRFSMTTKCFGGIVAWIALVIPLTRTLIEAVAAKVKTPNIWPLPFGLNR